MNMVFPERISQVRESVGFSKTDLAEKLGVSVAAVTQWENGTKHPTTDNLSAIARAVGVPMQLLLTPIPKDVAIRGPITFRARAAAKTSRLRRQAQRYAEMAAEAFIWVESWVNFPTLSLPELSPGDSPEAAATQCRRIWGLGDRPIAKLGELLESKGIRLCSAAFGDTRMDAYSCIIGGRAFAFLNNMDRDRARCRFDVAHELGHLVQHQHLSDEDMDRDCKTVEREADSFASAFLLPAETFSKDIVDPSLDGFKRLKPKWGVSVQAMVRRAWDLQLITDATYETHYRRMSMLGWRKPKGEPLDESVAETNRLLGKRSLELLKNGNEIQPWEVPASLSLPSVVLRSVFDTDFETVLPGGMSNIIVLPRFEKEHSEKPTSVA